MSIKVKERARTHFWRTNLFKRMKYMNSLIVHKIMYYAGDLTWFNPLELYRCTTANQSESTATCNLIIAYCVVPENIDTYTSPMEGFLVWIHLAPTKFHFSFILFFINFGFETPPPSEFLMTHQSLHGVGMDIFQNCTFQKR